MLRNQFLISLGSLAPFSVMALNFRHQLLPGLGFRVAAGESRYNGHMRLQGVNSNILDVKISGKDTDGGLAVFEQTSVSPGKGTPLHVHPLQDESFYVIEGRYFFKVGADAFHLSAGDTIFLPRGVPHGWTQLSDKGKLIVNFQPAGKMEAFFLAVSSLKTPPTPEIMAALFTRHEMQIVGPPVKPE